MCCRRFWWTRSASQLLFNRGRAETTTQRKAATHLGWDQPRLWGAFQWPGGPSFCNTKVGCINRNQVAQGKTDIPKTVLGWLKQCDRLKSRFVPQRPVDKRLMTPRLCLDGRLRVTVQPQRIRYCTRSQTLGRTHFHFLRVPRQSWLTERRDFHLMDWEIVHVRGRNVHSNEPLEAPHTCFWPSSLLLPQSLSWGARRRWGGGHHAWWERCWAGNGSAAGKTSGRAVAKLTAVTTLGLGDSKRHRPSLTRICVSWALLALSRVQSVVVPGTERRK